MKENKLHHTDLESCGFSPDLDTLEIGSLGHFEKEAVTTLHTTLPNPTRTTISRLLLNLSKITIYCSSHIFNTCGLELNYPHYLYVLIMNLTSFSFSFSYFYCVFLIWLVYLDACQAPHQYFMYCVWICLCPSGIYVLFMQIMMYIFLSLSLMRGDRGTPSLLMEAPSTALSRFPVTPTSTRVAITSFPVPYRGLYCHSTRCNGI